MNAAGNDPAAPAIAVIGMACRFPGARSVDAYWRNLRDGIESIERFDAGRLAAAGLEPGLIGDPAYVPAKGVLPEADAFDAALFGFSPREAALIDPQQRVLLECAWTALEHAGYAPGAAPGRVGVFAGSILSAYLLQHLWPNRPLVDSAGVFQIALGNDPTFLATRISYLLDLHGPSLSVGTACSTSLMAVHLACQSLLAHECDMALAGGVSIHLPLAAGYRYSEGGILSPDGHCRPFDADAQGTVSSDGAGLVLLKRLDEAIADGDRIHAVIRGSAANNDGRGKVGYTAPGVRAQADVIAEALAMADVAPDGIAFVEAHAAGTRLGDPVEVAALADVFAGCPSASCALGSVKSKIGHVDAAAGIAGLIKAVLSLDHRALPATLHYRAPNPEVRLSHTPFFVNADLLSLANRSGPLRAGVSSFGIGGTNVHVVLEEFRPLPREAESRPCELVMLSARSPEALQAAARDLAGWLETRPDAALSDVAFTLRCGRKCFQHRQIVVAADARQAAAMLRAGDPNSTPRGEVLAARPSLAFMFPGLGDHYPGMGAEFYRSEPVFRDMLDRCAALLRQPLGRDIREHLYRDAAGSVQGSQTGGIDLRAMLGRSGDVGVEAPDVAQPAIFATEVALAALLRDWGLEPEAMIGHSTGEFAAAWLAGVMSLDDALTLVATRAKLIAALTAPGAMLAVPLGEHDLAPLLPDGVSLAASNAPKLSVASGPEPGIAALARLLAERGIDAQRLRSTHAYHSAMMQPVVAPLAALIGRMTLSPPRIPFISCRTGTWIAPEQATSPAYWAEHAVHPVRFRQGLSELLSDPARLPIEVGPGQSLTAYAAAERLATQPQSQPAVATMRWSYQRQPEHATLARAAGLAWIAGAPLDVSRLFASPSPRRVPLPTYPFERRRHWIDPLHEGASPAAGNPKRPRVDDWFYLPSWKPAPCGLSPDTSPTPAWLVFTDACGIGVDLAARLRHRGDAVTIVSPGDGFADRGTDYTLDPGRAEDYRALLTALLQRGGVPTRIVHLCSLGADEDAPSRDRFSAQQSQGFHSLTCLVQALGAEGFASETEIAVIGDGLYQLSDEQSFPEKATLIGPALVGSQEYPGLAIRVIDIGARWPHDRDALLARILRELDAGEGGAVAWRGERRFVQAYAPIALPAPAASPFRRRGVYLITGGLGGVGLALARHLAHTAAARLVLVGRSAFPPREMWDEWLSSHAPDDATAVRIRTLPELESAGADLLVLSAEVSDRQALRHVLAETERQFGALHGVIHAAGMVGPEAFREIGRLTQEDADAQFASKAYGVLELDAALAGRDLDFVLLMSSLAAVLGGLGFAAYSAANAFMDSFARRQAARSGTPWVSVDWDSWRLSDTRAAVPGFGATVNDFGMQPEEAADACERVLAHGLRGSVVVSTGDLSARLAQWVERDRAIPVAAVAVSERPALRSAYVAPRGQIETVLAEIWSELFGIAPIGVNDSFFDLGGHSLLATQLNARIAARLRVEMSLAGLLQAPTIAEMASAVVAAQAMKAGPGLLESMLSEIGAADAASTDSEVVRQPDLAVSHG
jgi:acyl transferase domain-containing protein